MEVVGVFHSLPRRLFDNFCFCFSFKVSSIEVVTTVGGDFIPMWALNDQLRLFYGIIAVGTISGMVYIVGEFSLV